MTYDEFNTGGCNGCRYHGKDPEADFWRYADGTLRNDTCCHPDNTQPPGYTPGEPIPVFNTGCKRWTA